MLNKMKRKKAHTKKISVERDSPLRRIAGIVKLPDNYDYKKELAEILWKRYLSLEKQENQLS